MAADFSQLHCRLESERDHLVEEVERLRANMPRSDETRKAHPSGEEAEAANETFELEKRTAMEKRIRDQLAEVEHALDKFERGTYGLCDNCGQRIDPARLEALPQAYLCLDCKTRQSKNTKVDCLQGERVITPNRRKGG